MDVIALIERRSPLLAETMEDHRDIGDSCQASLPSGSESRTDVDEQADVDPDAGKDSMQTPRLCKWPGSAFPAKTFEGQCQ